jgi:argininosuccinate synthase
MIKKQTLNKNYKNPNFKIIPKINGKKPKVILLYSGGLDTSSILKYLSLKGYDVITLTADVGQQCDDLTKVKAKALKTGASKAYVVDLKKEFVENYILQILKTGSKYEGKYLMGCSPARAIISKTAVKILQQEKAQFIAHGCTAKGNDTTRFMINCRSLNHSVEMIVP